MSEESVKLKRKAKGHRPTYFENPEVDKLLAMLMGLAGEVSVMRDRLDTVERLVEKNGVFTRADIEAFQPTESILMERAKTRDVMLGEITRIIASEVEGLRTEQEESYERAIELVEGDREP